MELELEGKKPEQKMNPHTKIKIALALIVVIAIAAVAIYIKVGIAAGEKVPPKITGEMLSQELYGVEELVSIRWYYTDVAKFENSNHFFQWNVPLTKKRFLITYEGAILAGIRDLSQVQFVVEENVAGGEGESKPAVRVTVPPSEVLSHEIFENSVEVYDESRNVFNPITVDDFTGVMAEKKEADQAEAIEKGLLQMADQQVRDVIETFLSRVPGMEAYELVFE